MTGRAITERIAAAPISWGVCEVPGWGFQLDPGVVLAEMKALGVAATEFGPDGFLPANPADKAAALAAAGLRAVGGFVPVVLHDPLHDPLPEIATELDAFLEAGARCLVLSATTGSEGYDDRPQLDEAGWATLLTNLDRLAHYARGRGIVATLHPHVGTMIQTGDEIDRVLAGSQIGLCLDTGHILVGGGDPVALVQTHADRIGHVHLKDVKIGIADRVRNGELGYTDGVRQGLYTPLGHGDVDLTAIVSGLEQSGYDGYYVMEQDVILDGEPAAGRGPAVDVATGISFLRGILDRVSV